MTGSEGAGSGMFRAKIHDAAVALIDEWWTAMQAGEALVEPSDIGAAVVAPPEISATDVAAVTGDEVPAVRVALRELGTAGALIVEQRSDGEVWVLSHVAEGRDV